MAVVHIMLSDGFKDGKEIISMDVQTDREGLPEVAPDTPAMIQGLMFVRLWQCGALPRLVGLICRDAIDKRFAALQAVQEAQQAGPPGANGPPPPANDIAEKPVVVPLSPAERDAARAHAQDAEPSAA